MPSVGRQKTTSQTTGAGIWWSARLCVLYLLRNLITGLSLTLRLIVYWHVQQQWKCRASASRAARGLASLAVHSRAVALQCLFIDLLSRTLQCPFSTRSNTCLAYATFTLSLTGEPASARTLRPPAFVSADKVLMFLSNPNCAHRAANKRSSWPRAVR